MSVVVPAYNAVGTLAETLDSVLAQTQPAHDIIVVDDGSRDGTADVLAGYDGAIRVIRTANGGLASARRRGTEAATGDYIALLDADDICLPERLAAQSAVFAALPGVVLCASEFSAFDASGEIAPAYSAHYYAMVAEAGGWAGLLDRRADVRTLATRYDVWYGDGYFKLALGNFLHPPTLMFPRSLLAPIGPFDPEARSTADRDFIVRAAKAGPVAVVGQPLLAYRRSAGQMTSGPNRARNWIDNIHVLERTIARDPILFDAHRQEFAHRRGVFDLSAAEALIETDRAAALTHLSRSVFRHGHFCAYTLKVLVKLLIPAAVLTAKRALVRAESGK